MCKKMVKNKFFSKTRNTVKFTKKCSQEADIIVGTSEHFETKMNFVA